MPFEKCKETDFPIFSYTSGTTGDSKGVKLTHKGLMLAVETSKPAIEYTRDDIYISYLPYAHSYEQYCTYGNLIRGIKIGYYNGDPLRLIEDC